MPEGHTIRRIALDHSSLFGGDVLAVSSPQGKFVSGAQLLDGGAIERIDTHGKHLFYIFPGERILHIHLGLIGKFTLGEGPAPVPAVGAVRLRMEGSNGYVDLRGATVVEVISPEKVQTILARLGADPLNRRTRWVEPFAKISKSSRTIGQLLMEQDVIAGVGNVYRAEVLFRAGLSPFVRGKDLKDEVFEAIWKDLQSLMREGVKANRIVTTKASDRDGRLGPNRENWHYVYRRAGEACRVCGTQIRTELMVGRNLFWCPTCQHA